MFSEEDLSMILMALGDRIDILDDLAVNASVYDKAVYKNVIGQCRELRMRILEILATKG